MEYDASMMVFRSFGGILEVGMKSDKISWERSGKERVDQVFCQFSGRDGICVGIYNLNSWR